MDDFTTLFGGSDVEGGTLNYDAFVFDAGGVLFLSDAADVFASFSQGLSVTGVLIWFRRWRKTRRALRRPEPRAPEDRECGPAQFPDAS